MKNAVLLVLVCLFSLSCQKKTIEFKGVSGLNIGENFKSLPLSKQFRFVMDGEYFADRFHFSDGIGMVSDVSVSTNNDKIGEVKFYSTEETNISELNKILENLKEQKVDQSIFKNFGLEGYDLKIYSTENEDIIFSVAHQEGKNLKNGQPKYEFSYINKEMAEKNIKMTQKMIGKPAKSAN